MSSSTASARDEYPSPRVAWGTTAVVFLLTTVAMADRLAISMLIGPIKADFGIGDFKASLLVGAAFIVFYVLFLLPIGWAADRYSRRRVLTICLIVWTVASIACGFATGFVMLFVLRMLIGAGEAGLGPASHGLIGASFPRERLSKPLALQSIGLQVGGAAGIAGAGAILSAGAAGNLNGLPIIGDFAPWRIAFVAIGLPGLLALLLVPLIYDPLADGRRLQPRQVASTPELPFIRANLFLVSVLMMAIGASAIGFGSISAWSPEFLMRSYAVAPATAGAAFGSTMLVAAILSQLIFSTLVDWLAKRGVYDAPILAVLPLILLAIPAAWFSYRAPDMQSFLTGQFLLLCCVVPCSAMSNTSVQQIAPPELRSRLSAIMVLILSIFGFGFGPAVAGWLSEYVVGEENLGVAVSTVIIGAMIATFVLLVLVRRRFVVYNENVERSKS